MDDVHLPSLLLARPRFFSACSAKDTVRLLISRPVALMRSAMSAAERAPCWSRTSEIAAPMVWRGSAGSLAFGSPLSFGRGVAFGSDAVRRNLIESQDFALGDAKIGDLRLQFSDFRVDAFEGCVHDACAHVDRLTGSQSGRDGQTCKL